MHEAYFIDESLSLEVAGGTLYLEQVGPATAPVILYLHGGPGYSSHSFRDLFGDELTRYRMIYLDQREGESDPTILAADVIAVLDALDLPRATLLAHGYGALIAVTAAAKHPTRIERLILVNPWVAMPLLARTLQRTAARLSGHEALALPPEHALTGQEDFDPAALVAQATGWLSGKQLLDAMLFPRPSSRMQLEHSDATALTRGPIGPVPDTVWTFDVRALLSQLRQPTVVMLSQDDKSCYPEQAEAVLARLPHALTGLLPGGHYPWLDAPEDFLSVLAEAMRTPPG
jgi:proline iminopeptidase